MTRIQNQVREHSELAMSALSWISNARRPLKWNELQHALAVRRGDKSMDEEALVDETRLVSISAGLITHDAQSEIVRLSHFTVEEYFERNKAWFPNADSQIAEVCTTYLSFDVFATGHCPSWEELELRLQENRFLMYASQNWGHHTLRADENINEAMTLYFLSNDRMVSCCNQARLNESLLYNSDRRHFVSGYSSGLHLASQYGLLSICKILLRHSPGADSKDYKGQTPLTLAASEGQVEIVEFLVDKDDVAADSRDRYGRTPLSHAALHGHIDIVKLLSIRDDVIADSRDENSRTPLSYAASYGRTDIVKLLLARDDVVADSRNYKGCTPLFFAADHGHIDIVKLLFTRDDVVVDARDNAGRTPLSYAAERGLTDTMKLLLTQDAIAADSRDNGGRTPLSYAAEWGYETAIKLLLDRRDVVVDSRNIYGRTPLLFAARSGREAIVKLLLDRSDVVADSRDNLGQTPLSYAAKRGYETVVKLLLDRGDMVLNSQDKYGYTPLDYATYFDHVAVIQLLEEKLRSSSTDDAAEADQQDPETVQHSDG